MSNATTVLPIEELDTLVNDVTHVEGLAMYLAAQTQLNDGIETINNYRGKEGLTPETIAILATTYKRLRALLKVVNSRIIRKEGMIKEFEAINTEATGYIKHLTRTWMV